MPRGNETGQRGQGSRVGRGMRRCRGHDQGRIVAAGSGVYCICPHFGTTIPHKVGKACFEERCPKCGTPMQ